MSRDVPFELILRAAKDGDADTMNMLLSMGVSPNASNKINQTALHVAAIWGHEEVCKVLLDAGANVNARNQFGIAPLHMSAQNGHANVAQLLINSGADTRLAANNGMRPYDAAKTEAMRKLCGGPSLEGHAAVIGGDYATLEALLANGKHDVSGQDSEGETMLHLAVAAAVGEAIGDQPLIEEPDSEASAGSPKCLDLMLKFATSSPGFAEAQCLRNENGRMPIHIATSRGNLAVCRALLKAGAPVDGAALMRGGQHNGQWGKKDAAGKIIQLDDTDKTPLHFAVGLLQEQAESAEDDEEEDVVFDASLVRLMLEFGANPNSMDLEMQTPLHIAIMAGLHEVTEILLKAGADPSLGCKAFGKNNTALHQATILRDTRMIKLLAENGADVNAVGRDGWTSLGLAVRSNATEVCKVLLAAKANAQAVAGNGKTALEIATINNKQSLVALLQEVDLS